MPPLLSLHTFKGAARFASLGVLSFCFAPLAARSQDAPASPPKIERPKYVFLRQNEDWSVLTDVDRSETGDPFDVMKYVPLRKDAGWWASFGGHLRLRGEGWNNFNFGAPPAAKHDDSFLLTRLLLHTDFHFGRDFRVFAEGKSALAYDRDLAGGERPIDEDPLDLQQLFADISAQLDSKTRLTFRPGRMMLQFGKQRLVSPLPWANALRTWDGLQAFLDHGSWKLTGFWTQFVPVDQHDFNEPNDANAFYGAYATHAAKGGTPGFDFYWLGLHNDVASFNGVSGEEDRQTFGSRIFGNIGQSQFDYDAEGAFQLGDLGEADIAAGMFGAQLGHRFADAPWRPRPFVGLDYASGDGGTGGDAGTFNQLFPLGHLYLGYIDAIGRQNIRSVSIGVEANPTERLTLELSNYAFWLDDSDDALYDAGGNVLRPGGSFQSSDVGFEVDLLANYSFDRHLQGQLGYSHFFAGEALEESGPSDDVDFVYLGLQLTF